MASNMHAQFFLIAACLALVGCERTTPEPGTWAAQQAAPPAKSPSQLAREKLIADCRSTREDKIRAYTKLMGETNYWEASTAIRQCSNVLDDKELGAMVNRAELMSTWKDIKSPKVAPGDRLRQIEALRRDWPEEAKANDALLTRLAKENKRLDDLASAAIRRRSGVSLGMSPEEVLASSWGKPERVNRTTNAYGTSEQWVYGGRNYLYFENGVLTSIQN